MTSFRHKNVELVLTTEVILSFDPDAKSDEGREGAVRDGWRKIDANVEG